MDLRNILWNDTYFRSFPGQYKIHELDKVMWSLNKEYGNIVKVGGLIGHPDLLFVFNGDDIRKVFKQEEALPHRPSMPSLHYYKQKLKKDFFVGNAGVIGVYVEIIVTEVFFIYIFLDTVPNGMSLGEKYKSFCCRQMLRKYISAH